MSRAGLTARMATSGVVLAITASALLCVACAPPHTRAPSNVIDLRYRFRPAADSIVDIYRWTGSRTAPPRSRCKMVPTDSQVFAVRAARCGGLRAWLWGVSRLFVEEANSPRFTHPMRVDGRLRWVDLPADRCD